VSSNLKDGLKIIILIFKYNLKKKRFSLRELHFCAPPADGAAGDRLVRLCPEPALLPPILTALLLEGHSQHHFLFLFCFSIMMFILN